MKSALRRTVQFFAEIYQIWVAERPAQLAAALAYYSIFSFAPVIYVVFMVAEFFLGELLARVNVYDRTVNMLGVELTDLVYRSVDALSQTTSQTSILISLIGFLILLYAASGLFFQVQYALNQIWQVPPPAERATFAFIYQRLFSFIVVIGLGALLILVVVANFLLTWFQSVVVAMFSLDSSFQWINQLATVALATVALAVIYKILPETKIGWRDTWLGAVLATVLMGIGALAINWYFNNSNFSSAFNAAGSFTVLLMGFYYFAQIFLFGAVCTRVYADAFGTRRNEKSS